MNMAEAIRLAETAAAAREAQRAARAAELESHAVTFAAYQRLGATILAEQAAERARAVRALLEGD